MSFTVMMRGKVLPEEEIQKWELKRAKFVYDFLQKNLGLPKRDITRDENGLRDIDDIRHELAMIKIDAGQEKLREILKENITKNEKSTALLMKLCRGKTKYSIIEITGEGASAKYISENFKKMMLENSDENYYKCMIAAPDHYILQGLGDDRQEIVEAPAGMAQQSRFVAAYGDESGLSSERLSDYEYQSAGTAYADSGLAIGGVRHQFKEMENGFKVRNLVEFPSIMPGFLFRAHEMHLACEFSSWLNMILEDKKKEEEVAK